MKKISLIIFLLFLSEVTLVYAEIPQKINFQGVLNDNNGNPLSGTHQIDLKIFDSPSSPSPLWSETQMVNVSSGIFNIQIGSVNPLGIGVFSGSNRYLEISVDGTPLLPRQQLISQPYSFIAEKAYGIYGSTITTANIVDGTITGNDINFDTNVNISSITLGNAYSPGNIRHQTFNVFQIENKTVTFYKNTTGAALNMGGHKISTIGPRDTGTGIGMTLTGDGNGYMRIYVPDSTVTNSGLYIGAENDARTGTVDLNSNKVRCYYRFYPGRTQTGGYNDVSFIVADDNYIRTNTNFAPGGQDVAELMPAEELLEPGDVVVINENKKLVRCSKEYDKRLVGVVSERAGVLLGAGDTKSTEGNLIDGYPVALTGRVYVKVDADKGSIEIGDLLTTSSTPGHAMKAKLDSLEKISTIIGKALEPLSSGKGKILVLINKN